MSLPRTTPDTISSILLTDWRMRQRMPEEKICRSFTKSPPDYRYIDAFATLCSFVPQCDSAAAAIELGTKYNRLYIATSPPITPSLREVLPTWILLIQQLPAMGSLPTSVEDVSDKLAESPYYAAPAPIQNFIAEVYHKCDKKLLDTVKYLDGAEWILKYLRETSDDELRRLGFDIAQRPLFAESLHTLITVADSGIAGFSVKEILRLHHAVRTVANFKNIFSGTDLLDMAGSLSKAIEFIVAFATSKDNRETVKLLGDVKWIDTTSAEIIVTTNTEQLNTLISDGRKPTKLELPAWLAAPPKTMSKIEGFQDDFRGTCVMHCESALLQYILDKTLSVDPYIGTSHPPCYACRRFADALDSQLGKKFLFGSGDERIDPTWLCPTTHPAVYKKLASDFGKDFRALSTWAR